MLELINEFKALDGTFGQAFARSSHCRFHRIGLTYDVKSRAGKRSQRRPAGIGVDVEPEFPFLQVRD
jgi:hypothetical protein